MLITMLLHLLVPLSFSFSPTYCAPHTSITAIQEQLNSLGYFAISSQNNFESSFKCEACQATLKFQNSFQAVWLLKRHTGEKTHQIKAGWILDEENNVKMSRPKGNNLLSKGNNLLSGHLSTGPRSEFTAQMTISHSSKEQVSATNGHSSFPRKRSVAGSVTVLYYYDEEKERIIHLLLHILFIFDLINIYMDNITYYYVIAALMSINAFLLINCVGILYSSLLGLIVLLVTCYMFADVCSSKRYLSL